jgi:hypothetical protein
MAHDALTFDVASVPQPLNNVPTSSLGTFKSKPARGILPVTAALAPCAATLPCQRAVVMKLSRLFKR